MFLTSLGLWGINIGLVIGFAIFLFNYYRRDRLSIASRMIIVLIMYWYAIFVNLFLFARIPVNGDFLSQVSIWGDISGYSVLLALLFHFDRRSHNRYLAILAKLTYMVISTALGFLLISAYSRTTVIVGSKVVDGLVVLVRSPPFATISFIGGGLFIFTFYVFLKEIPQNENFNRLPLTPERIVVLLFVILTLSQGIFSRTGIVEFFLFSEILNTIVLFSVIYPQVRYPEVLFFKRFNTIPLLKRGYFGWAMFKLEGNFPQIQAFSTQFMQHHQLPESLLLGQSGALMLMVEKRTPILIFSMPAHPEFTVISIPVSLNAVPCPQGFVFAVLLPSSVIEAIPNLKSLKPTIYSEVSSLPELERIAEENNLENIFVPVIQRLYAS